MNTEQINDLMEKINAEQVEADKLTKQKEQVDKELKERNATIEAYKKQLLPLLESSDPVEYNNLVAQKMIKKSPGYSDEDAIIAYLQKFYDGQFVKTTYSINKNDLKKELKTNTTLTETLKPYMGEKVTEYVVVTTKENHIKMLEHMEAGK